jgi:hypothetical protein
MNLVLTERIYLVEARIQKYRGGLVNDGGQDEEGREQMVRHSARETHCRFLT